MKSFNDSFFYYYTTIQEFGVCKIFLKSIRLHLVDQ